MLKKIFNKTKEHITGRKKCVVYQLDCNDREKIYRPYFEECIVMKILLEHVNKLIHPYSPIVYKLSII